MSKFYDHIRNVATSASHQPGVPELRQLFKQMPLERFAKQGASVASGIIGTIIGAWFDAGATPEQVKRYIDKQIDVIWAAYVESQE